MRAESGLRATPVSVWIVGATCLPFVILHFVQVWARPQYQFIPLFTALLGVLAWQRWSKPGEVQTGQYRPGLMLGLLLAALPVACVSVLLYSPWLGTLSAILVAGAVLTHCVAPRTNGGVLPVWLLLLLPLPVQLDTVLVSGLQNIVAAAASALLDLMSLTHLREGTVIELPDRRLLVEEACSGVQSLFALFAMTGLYVVWHRRGFLHAMLLLVSAVGWAMFANLLRIGAIVIAAAQWDVDLSTGWQHEAIGFVAFGFGLLMMASTDLILGFLLDPIEGERLRTEDETSYRVRIWWNRLICGWRPVRKTSAAATDATQRRFAPLLVVILFVLLGCLQGLEAVAPAIAAHSTVPVAGGI